MFSQVDNLFVKVSAGIKIEAEIKREDLCHRIEKRTDFAVSEQQPKTFYIKMSQIIPNIVTFLKLGLALINKFLGYQTKKCQNL